MYFHFYKDIHFQINNFTADTFLVFIANRYALG